MFSSAIVPAKRQEAEKRGSTRKKSSEQSRPNSQGRVDPVMLHSISNGCRPWVWMVGMGERRGCGYPNEATPQKKINKHHLISDDTVPKFSCSIGEGRSEKNGFSY